MINKLIVIGVDGMDFDVVKKYENCLPNLSKMLKANGYNKLRSVFPADTTPAWSTIFTGQDPSEHGIINFVNIGDRENKYKPICFDDLAFKGKTFWDKLNFLGFSCAVLFPMNIKEGWEINALMITRPFEGRVNVFPEEKRRLYKPKYEIMGTDAKFTSEDKLKALRDEFFNKAQEEFRITLAAIENESCDMLFSYFSTVDGIQHDFWKHCDENHPEFPGETEFRYVIRDMYKKIDEYIGEIIERCPDTPLLVISDHGHGARPVFTARINEMLRREGYLTPNSSASKVTERNAGLKSVIKKSALKFVKKYGLPKWAVRIAKKVPVWKSIFASSNDFDWDKTLAYLSDLSALKNYSYGGIRIKEGVEKKRELCDEIIEKLKKIKLEDGKDAFLWIRRVDSLYHGPFLDKYPSIIFQLDERYGAEWSLGENLFQRSGFMHTLSPGSHRYETAVIAARGISLEKTQYEMTDIFDLIVSTVCK